jgi:hypothetical protein
MRCVTVRCVTVLFLACWTPQPYAAGREVRLSGSRAELRRVGARGGEGSRLCYLDIRDGNWNRLFPAQHLALDEVG